MRNSCGEKVLVIEEDPKASLDSKKGLEMASSAWHRDTLGKVPPIKGRFGEATV